MVEDERILLIRKLRGLGAGKINGPGGKLDAGETPRQAAVREVEEELGITPLDPIESGQLRFQFVDGYSIHVWVYRTRDFAGEPVETAEAKPLWVSLDKIPYEQMWEDDKFWLPMVIAGERFQTRWIFDDDTMLDYDIQAAGRNESWAVS